MNNSNNNGFGSEKKGGMKLNIDLLANAIKNRMLDEFERQQSNHTHKQNNATMQERIEENRKYLNADDSLVFDYVEDLGLWIIGGYGPVDIQEDGLNFELPTSSDLPNGAETFLPYLTECDASEGFNVLKFKFPYLEFGADIVEADIYFIRCTNNGTTYFACTNLTALRSFILYENEERKGNHPKNIKALFRTDETFVFDYIDEAGLWVIGNDKYDSIDCWPSFAKWATHYDREMYADILKPILCKDYDSKGLKSVCYFKIPYWGGGHEIKEEFILAIKCDDNTMYYASPNQDALRSFVLWIDEWIKDENEWKKKHKKEIC